MTHILLIPPFPFLLILFLVFWLRLIDFVFLLVTAALYLLLVTIILLRFYMGNSKIIGNLTKNRILNTWFNHDNFVITFLLWFLFFKLTHWRKFILLTVLNIFYCLITWFRINFCVYSSCFAKLIVIFHKLTTCFIIKWWFWKGYDQKTFYNFKDVWKWPFLRIPIFF